MQSSFDPHTPLQQTLLKPAHAVPLGWQQVPSRAFVQILGAQQGTVAEQVLSGPLSGVQQMPPSQARAKPWQT